MTTKTDVAVLVKVLTAVLSLFFGVLAWVGVNVVSDVNELKLDMREVKSYMGIYHGDMASRSDQPYFSKEEYEVSSNYTNP